MVTCPQYLLVSHVLSLYSDHPFLRFRSHNRGDDVSGRNHGGQCHSSCFAHPCRGGDDPLVALCELRLLVVRINRLTVGAGHNIFYIAY
jgi:hypothetical protein